MASADDSELRLVAGSVVEGIEIISELDRGGMGIVYRGRRLADGMDVAVKVGTAEAARHQTEARFRNEARLGNVLHHPNIVRALHVTALTAPAGFEGRMCLVTEFVQGRTLSWLMVYHRQGMPTPRAVRLAIQLADAMVAMHDQGVVHRDLKPANLIIDDDDRLHVIDFGLGFALGTDEDVARTPDLTLEGAAPGTPLYMSPQQALHQAPTGAFDVYAFGVVLYELLSGSAPNSDLPTGELVVARCNPKSKLFPLRRIAPHVPETLVELVEACLAYDANDRPSAPDIAARLRVVEAGLDLDPPVLPLHPAPSDDETKPTPAPNNPKDPPRTRLHRRPPVVAEGARPAGEDTLAQLVRDRIDMPSVQRTQAELDKAARDGCAVTNRIQVLAAITPDEGVPEPSAVPLVPDTREEARPEPDDDAVTTTQPAASEDHPRTSRRPKVVLAASILFALAVAVAIALRQDPPPPADTPRALAPAAVVQHDLGDDPQPAAPSPKVDVGFAPESLPSAPAATTAPSPAPSSEASRPKRSHQKKKQPHHKGTPTTDSAPQKPGPLDVCAKNRVEARKAGKARAWKAVLAATRDATCWSSKTERARLRARAFRSLGRYAACVSVTHGAQDPEVLKLGKECYRLLSEEEPP